jgi:hypothetical protein
MVDLHRAIGLSARTATPFLSANADALCKLACVLNAESLSEVPVIGLSLPTGRVGALSDVQCKSDPDESPGCELSNLQQAIGHENHHVGMDE